MWGSQSQDRAGDLCQLASPSPHIHMYGHVCFCAQTSAFDEPSRLITVHTLSIPILQLSDILLREINFQCVLAAGSGERPNVSPPQPPARKGRRAKKLKNSLLWICHQFRAVSTLLRLIIESVAKLRWNSEMPHSACQVSGAIFENLTSAGKPCCLSFS